MDVNLLRGEENSVLKIVDLAGINFSGFLCNYCSMIMLVLFDNVQ